MRSINITLLITFIFSGCSVSENNSKNTSPASTDIFKGQKGTLVIIDIKTGKTSMINPDYAKKALSPCSTFKIWNTLIGLKEGLIKKPSEAFYKWDGKKRFFDAWNRDLTLKEAFRVSCVPAFQNLASRIGAVRMKKHLDTINYGDRNISSGITDFWLPRKNHRTIMISAVNQAVLITELLTEKLPFSPEQINILKELMFFKKIGKCNLYGKTGSSGKVEGSQKLGWYTGFIICNNKTLAFSANLASEDASGSIVRDIIYNYFKKLQ
ncbi:MAG: class D beta-lactamase [Deltaproteobacteria bacterium]|nr:class D beta-lactamase [Deltaproteobacteria bacterium]